MAQRIRLTAATAAVTNRFVTSTNMANGAYTLANTTMPTDGGRLITATITAVTGNDTPGTITVVGTDLRGEALTEVITLTAGGSATGSSVFRTVTSITQAGWVINTGNDTIVIGCSATPYLASRNGVLHKMIVGATAAGTITLADAGGTIAVFGNSFPVGVYDLDLEFAGSLTAALGAASDVTLIATQYG